MLYIRNENLIPLQYFLQRIMSKIEFLTKNEQAGINIDLSSIPAESSRMAIAKLVDWGTYDQKMQAIAASGEPADLIFTSNWTNDYLQNVNKGALLDITDLLPKYGPDIMKQVPPKIK